MIVRYTRTAVVLHWAIALIVVAQFGWGWLMQEIPKSPPGLRADAFNFHKSIGLCLLALMLFRLGWRSARHHCTRCRCGKRVSRRRRTLRYMLR